MHKQLISDVINMKPQERRSILMKMGVTFQQGQGESTADYVKRVLTAIDNDGNIRLLEQLISEVVK